MSAAMLIPVIVLATVLFYRYIEKPAIKLAGSFEKFVSSKESIVPQVEIKSKASENKTDLLIQEIKVQKKIELENF
jgi:peptidoglycan/LPS O-acetylase OafA/YrhL